MNEDSSVLWHRRLGHISIERIKKLVNDGALNTLDFTYFDTFVDCIKGKQTNVSKKGAKKSSNLLEIIHTDICCPDFNSYGKRYFITFIDDYSCDMCIYFLDHKAEALDAFKVFKVEVEQGIVAQYTMPDSSNQNGVAERRNRTLLDMVRSMMVSSKLPKFLWIEALKMAVYILNHEPVDPVVPYISENIEQPVDQQAPPENVDATLRRSTRIKRSTIPSDYMVYLQEYEFNIGVENDPEMFSQAMRSGESNLWYDAMKEEINSMAFNEVWDLVELPDGFKAIGCKWVFKQRTHRQHQKT
ncbi:UNVERIFIED_CONTAM: hypothetical protein Sangu_2033300 [Sesamum angustifolium]|uniref:Integrase catalytic domain-containing protein n=1 Tax=Sesamum angustifolium TaxID=2727405 RepID=A0AAW2LKM4_9LAMI